MKTQQELDAEMEDYWGSKEESAAHPAQSAQSAPADGDVDMIE
jgi:THO complex subunit 4